MRYTFNQIGRGATVVAVLCVLAMPMQGGVRARDDDRPWLEMKREKIIKVIKKAIRSFGDGLIDPRP